MKCEYTWKLVQRSLQQNLQVMLLYVLDSSGSSPGRQGFFMAINEAGETSGSIGGGMMEHKFVEMAREKLRTTGDRTLVRRQIHNKEAVQDRSGMICSGEQTIFLYRFSDCDLSVVNKVINILELNRNGTLALSPLGISFENSIPEKDNELVYRSESDWVYREKLGYKNYISIIGGGHCALALSRVMANMDFYVRVYDDRSDLKTMEENLFAHEKHLIDNYGELGARIKEENNHYAVVMTVGYRTDDQALRAIMFKDFKFLGLLGSASKTSEMIKNYRKEGMDPLILQRIHTPVGLAIRSQTPEEIAISIAAQIIMVKNGAPT
jgi:xanthine dehydrogenase accessory factor